MGMAKDVLAEVHAVWATLEAEGHKEADRLHAVYEHLHDLLPGVETEVKTDVEQVAKEAVAAEEPVAAEAVHDAETVAEHAVADVTAPAAEPTKQ